MATISPRPDPESDPRVKAVFDDIRATRGTDFINNFWRYLAFDAQLLEEVWRDVRDLMARPTVLESKVKEMIYAAVSIASGCEYCIHSHTAAAKAQGMTDAEHAEMLRIVSMAGRTNRLADGLGVPVDEAFDANA